MENLIWLGGAEKQGCAVIEKWREKTQTDEMVA